MIHIMLPVCFGAVMLGDLIMYTLGRVWGDRVKQMPLFRRYLTPAHLEKAQMKFHEHGGKALFIARFLPGLRTATFFSAGVFKIPAWKMIAFDGAAALLSVPVLVLLPYYLGSYISEVKELLKDAQTAVLALAALALVAFYIYVRMRAKKRQAAATDPAPTTTPSNTHPEQP